MTTGYLWTGQFEECKVAAEEGRPHSMELDKDTLKGHWAQNKNNGMDFFIINDAIFSKLCILGADVEPCFEGSSVTEPNVSSHFTKMDDDFKKTLFTMMQELQFALQGGQQMENEVVSTTLEGVVENTEASVVAEAETPVVEKATPAEEAVNTEDFAASKKEDEEEQAAPAEEKEEASEEDDDKKKEYSKEKEEEEEEENSDTPAEEEKEDEDEEEKKKYALLETEFAALQEKYSALEKEYEALVAFKAEIEDAKKDEMIAQFSFLSDEDKKDVIENKAKYTIDEIESKLSVICVRNRVNFDLGNSSNININTEEPVVTFSLSNEGSSTPDWIKAIQNNKNNK